MTRLVPRNETMYSRAQEDAAFCVYDWRKDAIDSFHFALHMKALAIGAKRFRTIHEMHWIEQNGEIP